MYYEGTVSFHATFIVQYFSPLVLHVKPELKIIYNAVNGLTRSKGGLNEVDLRRIYPTNPKTTDLRLRLRDDVANGLKNVSNEDELN